MKKSSPSKKHKVASSKRTVTVRSKPQRPFYKSSNFVSNGSYHEQEPEGGKRFMHWVCSPQNQCTPAQNVPFTENLYWRIFRIIAEFIEGFEFLSKLNHEVTFFGSARAARGTRYYKAAEELARMCGKAGLTVITGGGPGIMEAANKGAFNAGGESIGLDIELPTEQRRNEYVTRAIGFHYFFTRKVMLSASAQAYVFFPGGFGTLDEASEMITLIETGKMPRNIPCIFYGKAFWTPFYDWMKTTLMQENSFISQSDIEIVRIVDTPKEAFEIIRKSKEREL
ncbi:MAG: TIGR00730 family Rossman fold protein [Patescibacteria group bacterium]